MVFDIRKAAELDISSRIRELRPVDLLRDVAQVRNNMVCIDLGCGTGTFTLPMSSLAGDSGKVFAVDRSAEMLQRLMQKSPPPNIIIIQSDVSSTGLDSEIADLCLMGFILHEVKEPNLVIVEAARLLKPGGRALIVEWIEGKDSPGPPARMRIGRKQLNKILQNNNFSDCKSRDWSVNYYITDAIK